MAFIKTSDSILIKATLTEKGKKLMARGKFKIAKFALADDEVDYRLYNIESATTADYEPALKNTKIIEALKDSNNNLQFGLNSYDSGVLYLREDQLAILDSLVPHAFVEYLPILVKNEKTAYAPTLRNDKYYVSINNETTKILNDNLTNFKFLEVNDFDKIKIVIESGIDLPTDIDSSPLSMHPTLSNREDSIIKKFLLDQNFLVYADNRLISGISGMQQTSQFENYGDTEKIINFNTALELSPPVSLESTFDYYATYLASGIPNMIIQDEANPYTMSEDELSTIVADGQKYSALKGPRGSILAFNVATDNKLKINSTGIRDSRFTEFGVLENSIFSEMSTRKFDYIDTTIYIVGATTNSRLQIPLRIIRYAGL
jgi:hypothetical protein